MEQFNLVGFQENILQKINNRMEEDSSKIERWLGFLCGNKRYLVELNHIKEITVPPDKYLYLGELVKPYIKGGFLHRDEVWTVFCSVDLSNQKSSSEDWERRLILLNPIIDGSTFAIIVDKIIGLMPYDDWERINDDLTKDFKGNFWNMWNPKEWVGLDTISEIGN